jgi:hypothetical protein
MKKLSFAFLVSVALAPPLLVSKEASALPVFARKYHTACSTCHLAIPVRNSFGEAFRNNGYRFPGGSDEEMVKEEPINLGADANKNAFPNAIWPSDIPNMPSLGFLAKTGLSSVKNSDHKKYNNAQIGQEVDVFYAGTITNQISYIGDFAIQPDDPNFTWGRLVLQWMFGNGINLNIGDVGFPERFTLISTKAGGDLNAYAVNLPTPNRGIEVRYAGDTGTSGGYSILGGLGWNTTSPTDPTVIDGNGSMGDTRYARATYKIGGLGLKNGSGGTFGNQFIGLDNSITFGANVFNSRDGGTFESEDGLEGYVKTAYSGDILASYGNFRTYIQYERCDEVLDVITKENTGKRTALSIEGDYWIYPWLFAVVRYEHLKDNLNGEYSKVIPGVGVLLRPNAKIGLEYVEVTKRVVLDPEIFNPVRAINFYAQLGF